jgi:hypothetical protein
VPSFSNLVYLNGLIALGCHEELAGIIVVETEDVGLRPAVFRIIALEQL